jgi:uncharacterized membrane protein YphA (DoxX/SURF4 family)
MTARSTLLSPSRVEWSIRIAFAVVYIWFGALKLADVSPVHDLVRQTLLWLPDVSYSLLGAGEIVLGLAFLIPRLTKPTLVAFLVHIGGTMLPLFFQQQLSFNEPPLLLSFIGQYIIKNLVFLAAAAALASITGSTRSRPDSDHSP